jgi:hypothetical protein
MNTISRLVSSLFLFTAAAGVAVAQHVDTVTAGGCITVTATASKANFGLNARNSSPLTGHLTYVDHATTKIVVHSTSITSYTIVNATTRTFTGTCEINGVGGFTFTCTVVDNGEPGTADTFSISLSSGYNASGTLGGGNVQVHPV